MTPALLLGNNPPSVFLAFRVELNPGAFKPLLNKVFIIMFNTCYESPFFKKKLQTPQFLWPPGVHTVSYSSGMVLVGVWLILSQMSTSLNLLSPSGHSLTLNFEPVDYSVTFDLECVGSGHNIEVSPGLFH